MGPISAVSTGILVAVIVTAVWLTLNQHRLQTATARMRDAVQRLLTRHLGHLGRHGIRWATRLFGGKALAVLTIGLITLCGLSALLGCPTGRRVCQRRIGPRYEHLAPLRRNRLITTMVQRPGSRCG